MYVFRLFWFSASPCSSIYFAGFVTVYMGKVQSNRNVTSPESSPSWSELQVKFYRLPFSFVWHNHSAASIVSNKARMYFYGQVLGSFIMVEVLGYVFTVKHLQNIGVILGLLLPVRLVSMYLWRLHKKWHLGLFLLWFSLWDVSVSLGCCDGRGQLS